MQYEEMQKSILEWKQKYEEVLQVTLMDKQQEYIYTFIFHTLGREEYKDLIVDGIDEIEFQEVICEYAVLYPENFDFRNGLAGIAEILSDSIIEASGLRLGQAKEILDYYREQMYIYDYQADCIIHEAFPEYPIEEIQSWSNKKTMYYLSRAEWILVNLKGVPLMPLDQQVAEDMQMMEEQQAEHQHNFQAGQPPQQQYMPQAEMYPEFQEQLDDFDDPFEEDWEQPQPSQPKQAPTPKQMPDGVPQSEAELLAMLGQKEAQQGRGIGKPISDQNERFAELAWFQHEEDLKGDFD